MSEQPATYTIQELVSAIIEQAGSGMHRHQWAVVGIGYPPAKSTYMGRPVHPRLAVGDDVTYVLVKCHCGEPRSYTLDGRWSMTELMTKIGEQDASSQEARSTSGPSGDADSRTPGQCPPEA